MGTNKRTASLQSEKTYSIWSNFRWGTRIYEELLGKHYHIIDMLVILLGVIAPFVGMAFPGVAVWLMQSGYAPGLIALGILIYALAMKFLDVWREYVDNAQRMLYFQGRVRMDDIYAGHLLDMDYEKMESSDGQKRIKAALRCILSGNEFGIEHVLKQAPLLVLNAIGFLIYSLLVLRISPWVFLYMVVTAVLLGWLNIWQGGYEERIYEKRSLLYMEQGKLLKETLDLKARKDILLYQGKDWLLRKLEGVNQRLSFFRKRSTRIGSTSSLAMAVLNFIRDAVVYVILITQIAEGLVTVEELLLLLGVVAGHSTWMRGLVEAVQKMAIQNYTITDFRNFLDYGKEEIREESPLFSEIKGRPHELRLEDVCYRYENAEEDTIRHMSLTIHPGEKLALVGVNGAGKTTLVKLLTGLYRPTSGKIFLDGVDIATIPREQYFREFAAVFQDSRVFACSVEQNVSGQRETDKCRVRESLVQAGLWERVQMLPEKMGTMLTKNLFPDGVEFSGGETQKLMLARALYQDAPVLILDEPTAALDPIAESSMYERYNEMGKGKTSIFISHRLCSTRFCDRICFLQDGKILEMGTHQTLMAAQGEYARMFAVQAQYYGEEEWKDGKEADDE